MLPELLKQSSIWCCLLNSSSGRLKIHHKEVVLQYKHFPVDGTRTKVIDCWLSGECCYNAIVLVRADSTREEQIQQGNKQVEMLSQVPDYNIIYRTFVESSGVTLDRNLIPIFMYIINWTTLVTVFNNTPGGRGQAPILRVRTIKQKVFSLCWLA